MIKFNKNDLIFRQGDAGDCAYIIEKGQVLIFLVKDKEEIPLSLIGPGEIFGEMSLLDNQNRSASARAIDETVLSTVNREQVMERVNSSDTVVQLLMRVLLKRIRNQNQKMVETLPGTPTPKDNWDIVPDQKALEKIKLEIKIKDAFANKEFRLYYQPIIDLQTNKIAGAEALLRWESPKELITPIVFIDLIENSSLIIPIGQWIIEQALGDLKDFHRINPMFVSSINISARQVLDPHFISFLEDRRKSMNIDARFIKLEMTERIMMEGTLALETLKACKQLGYPISIDDFGTGFSSLQYLAQMPIHDIKIDRTFVMKIHNDPKTQAIIETILFLARYLNFKVISEGIETLEERDWLKAKGSTYGQGWFFSKALPKDQMLEKLVQGKI